MPSLRDGAHGLDSPCCPACSGTGRRRDRIRLLYASASLVACLLLAVLAGFCRTDLQQILVHGFGGILMLALGYVSLSQLYRFATAKCLACGGHGSLEPTRRPRPISGRRIARDSAQIAASTAATTSPATQAARARNAARRSTRSDAI